MEFTCETHIVDAVMGTGKSTATIKMLNNSSEEEKFIVIVPYLTEVTRYKQSCPNKNFKEPVFEGDKPKFENLKKLIQERENIVTTHAMLQRFNNEIVELCKTQNYTLVLDEVANVIENYKISDYDFDMLMKAYVDVNPVTKQLGWKQEFADYTGKYDDEKRLCDLGSLVYYGDLDKEQGRHIMVWMFPVQIFNAFKRAYILTYMFNAQLQRCYYDYYGLPYDFLTVDKEFNFVADDGTIDHRRYNYRNLIHIIENSKINNVGVERTALSAGWYKRLSTVMVPKVKANIKNFFCNICESKAQYNMWTTFTDYEDGVKGAGYSKKLVYTDSEKKSHIIKQDKYGNDIPVEAKCGFVPINMRGTNDYKQVDCVAYAVNIFINPFVKNFFVMNGIEVDEDGYALSEMLQFIWRSAIREGHPITLYVPSKRMRTLLEHWINENSAPDGVAPEKTNEVA